LQCFEPPVPDAPCFGLNAIGIAGYFCLKSMEWHVVCCTPMANVFFISIGFFSAQLVIDVSNLNGLSTPKKALG
jgi:hypothetical protein